MLGDGNNFNSVIRKADKQDPIFYVYPERINQPMFRLQGSVFREGCEGFEIINEVAELIHGYLYFFRYRFLERNSWHLFQPPISKKTLPPITR